MLKYDKKLLKECANNLMFDMSEEQYDLLLKEFEVITKQMEILGEIEGVDEVEPMTFPYEVYTTYLREDEAETPLEVEEVLKNAKDVVDNQIKLPKVVN